MVSLSFKLVFRKLELESFSVMILTGGTCLCCYCFQNLYSARNLKYSGSSETVYLLIVLAPLMKDSFSNNSSMSNH